MVLGQGLFYLEIQGKSFRKGAFKMGGGGGDLSSGWSPQGSLLSGWSFIRVVFYQGGLLWVVFYQGGLFTVSFSGWSPQGFPLSGWSFICIFFNCFFIRVVFHLYVLSSGWSFNRVVSHQGFHCATFQSENEGGLWCCAGFCWWWRRATATHPTTTGCTPLLWLTLVTSASRTCSLPTTWSKCSGLRRVGKLEHGILFYFCKMLIYKYVEMKHWSSLINAV